VPDDIPQHLPVLLRPFIDALCVDEDGRYVDCTFGRGGHSRALLARLSPRGRLLALDRDPTAVREGESLAAQDERFVIAHADFASLPDVLARHGWSAVNGIGFDLGVSSPQLDQAERGFSFSLDGPLDMRMDTGEGKPLGEQLDRISDKALARIIREYGDERYAGRIARAILAARREGRLTTTRELENICFHAVPPQARFGGKHPATRTFQALRIWINDEFAQIDAGIRAAMAHLAPGGRLAVISFHSGEDRRVRDLIESEVHPCTCPPEFPVCVCGRQATMRWVHKKPVRPDDDELAANPRSRSAMMRVAERLAGATEKHA
jgi:16S rRNA (cytosine1402-N4)-methyltransferase